MLFDDVLFLVCACCLSRSLLFVVVVVSMVGLMRFGVDGWFDEVWCWVILGLILTTCYEVIVPVVWQVHHSCTLILIVLRHTPHPHYAKKYVNKKGQTVGKKALNIRFRRSVAKKWSISSTCPLMFHASESPVLKWCCVVLCWFVVQSGWKANTFGNGLVAEYRRFVVLFSRHLCCSSK